MSGEFFGSAAAYAQKQRAASEQQMYNGAPVTMENNALADLIKERNREEAERRKWAEAWDAKIMQVFAKVAETANACDREVESITFNGEVAFVRRKDEAIRVMLGKIRDMRDLQRAAASVMRAIIG